MDNEHPILHIAMNRQRGLFTTEDALGAGYSQTEIRRRVRSGRWQRVRRGVMTTREYAQANATAADLHARLAVSATLVVGRPSALSHESAAYEHGIAVRSRPEDTKPSITLPPRSLSRVPAVDVYRNTAHPGHVWLRPGADVTSPARTVTDLARLRPFADSVIAADSALHQGKTTKEELGTRVADCERWPGWRRALSVVEFADGRAQSPLESLGRVMCFEQELPEPVPQLVVTDRRGRRHHGDLGWMQHRTIAELDGRLKYTDSAAYGSGDPNEVIYLEKVRRDDIEEAGWEIVRLTHSDVVYRARESTARLRAAFARGQRRIA